jgi:hypothetical protein
VSSSVLAPVEGAYPLLWLSVSDWALVKEESYSGLLREESGSA